MQFLWQNIRYTRVDYDNELTFYIAIIWNILIRDLELKNWRHNSFWLVVHICDGKTHSDWLCWVAGSVVTQLADIISSYDQMRTEKETKLLAYTENIN